MVKNEAVEVDEQILKEVDNVDWHSVSEPEAASFGLSIGFFRDSNHACQLRKAALGTALGGMLSTSVLAILALLMGAGPAFALCLVLVHQLLRSAVLSWRSHQAKKQHAEIQQQAIATARRLAERYPARDAAAA